MANIPLFHGADFMAIDDTTDTALVPSYPTDGQGGITGNASLSANFGAEEVLLESFTVGHPGVAGTNAEYMIGFGYSGVLAALSLTYTDSGKTLAGSGAFSTYTHTAGDRILIVSGTGVSSYTTYEIDSKTNDNTIVLSTSIAGADGQTDLIGVVNSPPAFQISGNDNGMRGRTIPLGVRLQGAQANFYTFFAYIGGSGHSSIRYTVNYRKIR
jgi:hypothetical protein